MIHARLEFAKRLNALCDERGLPPKGKNRQHELGRIFGVSQPAARKWPEAEGWPTMSMAVRLAIWGGVHVEWLLTGRGQQRLHESPADAYARLAAALVHQMPENTKHQALRILQTLAQPSSPYDRAAEPTPETDAPAEDAESTR